MNLYLFNVNGSAAAFGIGTYINELIYSLKGTSVHIHIVHLQSDHTEFDISTTINDHGSLTYKVENWYIPKVYNQNIFDSADQKVEEYFRNIIYLFRLYIKDTTNLVFHFNYNLHYALAKGLKEVFDCKTVATIHLMKWQLLLQGNLSRFHAIKSKPNNKKSTFEQSLSLTDEYEKLLYKEVDRVIVLSQYTKKLLLDECRIDPDKVCIIPNGLSDIRVSKEMSSQNETDRNTLRRKWGLSENELLILFVGRLQAVKGLTYLLQAFRKVLNSIPNCRLMIAGNGDDEMYRKEAKDISAKISFTGLLEKKALYELYQIANIGVMPSFHEQCSYVGIEMMMYGVPLIASTSTGLREMVADGVTGLHIPVIEYHDKAEINTDLLAEKMVYLLQHPTEAKRLGRNARRVYEERYTSDLFRQNMLDFYNSLLEPPNA